LTLYRQALSDLHAIQCAGRDLDFSLAYPRPAFDRRAIMWDLNYFKYLFLKINHIDFDEELLENDLQCLASLLLQADDNYFLYRDFNPRNIMLFYGDNNPSAPTPTLYYIDYQGGRKGAAQYDVASLLYSAKSDLPPSIRLQLLRDYVNFHGDPRFMDYFWLFAILRILQTLGAYGYRGLYEQKTYFIQSIPLAIRNLRQILEDHPLPHELPELNRILTSLQPPDSPSLSPSTTLTVTIGSFSYKQGLPSDNSGNGGGHIFDCRALPNPGRYPEYKNYTGKDQPVIQFLQNDPAVTQFLAHAKAIVTQSIDKYLERHFTHLSVQFGCTGGQHRSVFCAQWLADVIKKQYPDVNVIISHRENP
ncbi:MAG: phosphotransferase, partial [Paludibacteraceae bacterium]|nr:phosphotransferase [Paludibacteraceae bacterium]